jgi:hypothetical protein
MVGARPRESRGFLSYFWDEDINIVTEADINPPAVATSIGGPSRSKF